MESTLSERSARLVNGIITHKYYYTPEGLLIGVADKDGNLKKSFIYATKSHVPDYFVDEFNKRFKIVTDQLGSVRLVVDAHSGEIIQKMNHDEFGNVILDSNPMLTPFGFAGGIYDRESKLVRFGARDYDPRIGRWTSKDPISFDGGDSNLYGYVLQDPINYIDPSGEAGIFGAILGAGIEIGFQAYFNYQNGKEIYDVDNYDWWDVGVSAAVGALSPGILNLGKTSIKSGRAISTISKQLVSSKTANRIGKLQGRIQAHKGNILNAIKTQAVFQGLKSIGKSANNCRGK